MFKWLKARRERREQSIRVAIAATKERIELVDFVPTVTADDVLRIIRRDFPDALPNELLAELGHFEQHRVHAAILKLSEGNRERVDQFVQLADQDFRDVLTLAESPSFFELVLSPEEFIERPIEEIKAIGQNYRDQYFAWFNRKIGP